MVGQKTPLDFLLELKEMVEKHPNAKILVSSPAADWDYIFCHVFDVGYEPELGFLMDDDLGWSKTVWSKDEYFSEYGDDPHPEKAPEFNEYIILWCD